MERASAKRILIPRWRSLARTPSKELESAHNVGGPLADNEDAESRMRAFYDRWQEHPTLENAVEVVEHALLVRQPFLAIGPAHAVLNSTAMPATKTLAQIIVSGRRQEEPENLEPPSWDALTTQLRVIKRRLLDEPRNGLLWLEKARLHTQKAELKNAKLSIRRALGCAPDNRFILRGFARFMGHLGDFKEAHDRLIRSPRVKSDPWIQAAELSVAQAGGLKPLSIRSARAMLEKGDYSPFHKSELAASLGTLEADAGKTRKAQQLFRESLQSPTDNSLSQAFWARDEAGLNLEISHQMLLISGAFEARVQSALSNRQFSEVVANSHHWLNDEPFSVRAATGVAYIASSILWDHELAREFCLEGLVANPDNVPILNNLVVSHARLGNLESAEATFALLLKVMPDITRDPVLMATRGLLAFRRGNIVLGRKDYAEAADLMRKARDADTVFRCYANWFYEEVRAGSLTEEEVMNLLSEGDTAIQKFALKETSRLVWSTFKTQIVKDRQGALPYSLHLEPQMLLNLTNY